jgi:hypothetical protein
MPKPDHLLFNADDVRTELHKVRDQLQRDKDEHIRNWEKSPSGHEDPKTCLPCKLWDARIEHTELRGGEVRIHLTAPLSISAS